MMSVSKEGSIGTLTGWQLLAEQVQGSAAAGRTASAGGASLAAHSGAAGEDDGSCGDHASAGRGSSAGGRHQHHQQQAQQAQEDGSGPLGRSLSNASGRSEDSEGGSHGGGSTASASASTSCVTPRPHQWLYREYKILDEIGSGGFGRVCRARRLADGRVVVVKEINTTSLSAKQKLATMDEVLVLAKLHHPNIVTYHDCFSDAVFINIVMEFCNAGDLAALLKGREGRRMPEAEVMSLFVQILLAMHYVHQAGVLHRDLKTSNVLITREDSLGGMPLLKLGDFGVAKSTGAESSMASTIVGTPQYLSPEMCDNKPYGKKSDVWALGCILYELCSLSKAFDGGNGGISGIILKIMRGAYEPLPPEYSADMQTLVGAMLQTKPRDRLSVVDMLQLPYVRHHLALYLDWARHVPQAHPQVLLASLGGLWPRGSGSKQGSQDQLPARMKSLGSGGSTGSLDTPRRTQHQQPQEAGGNAAQLRHQPSSSSSRAPAAAGPRVSATGSNSSVGLGSQALSSELPRQSSNMSSARSGGTTPRSAANNSSSLGPPLAPPAESVREGSSSGVDGQQQQPQQPQPQQQQQQQAPGSPPPVATGAATQGSTHGGGHHHSRSALPAGAAAVLDGLPAGSLSGWAGGDTSLQQRLAPPAAAHGGRRGDTLHPGDQQQQPVPAVAPAAPPPSTLPAVSGSASPAAGDWAYPSSSSADKSVRGNGARTSLAQEQIEGLKRIWALKSRLHVPHGTQVPAGAAAAAAAAAVAGAPLPPPWAAARDQQSVADASLAAAYDAALHI